MNRTTETFCHNCQSAKPFSSFHRHVVIGKQYLPYCKPCCNKRLKEYISATKNEGAGLWCMLAELGIPFLKKVWEPTQKVVYESTSSGRKPDLFLTYIRILSHKRNYDPETGIIVPLMNPKYSKKAIDEMNRVISGKK